MLCKNPVSHPGLLLVTSHSTVTVYLRAPERFQASSFLVHASAQGHSNNMFFLAHFLTPFSIFHLFHRPPRGGE